MTNDASLIQQYPATLASDKSSMVNILLRELIIPMLLCDVFK
jgi:hypothetical protein